LLRGVDAKSECAPMKIFMFYYSRAGSYE